LKAELRISVCRVPALGLFYRGERRRIHAENAKKCQFYLTDRIHENVSYKLIDDRVSSLHPGMYTLIPFSRETNFLSRKIEQRISISI
jgi:hypothetical protein